MTDSEIARYALAEARVKSHQPFGLILQFDGERRGFIDKMDISDESLRPDDWPPVGQLIPCVILGTTRDGRVRATAKPSDVTFAKAVVSPGSALKNWNLIRDNGFKNETEKQEFFALSDTVPVLRWALSRHSGSHDRIRAEEILANAPEAVTRQLSR